MKAIRFSVIVLLILSPVLVWADAPVEGNDLFDWTVADTNFVLKAPKSWTEDVKHIDDVKLRLRAPDGQSTVSFSTFPLAKDQTLENTLKQIPDALLKNPKNRNMKSGEDKLGELPAVRLQYDRTIPNGQEVRIVQRIAIKDQTQYVLTFTSPIKLFDAMVAEEVAIAKSVHQMESNQVHPKASERK